MHLFSEFQNVVHVGFFPPHLYLMCFAVYYRFLLSHPKAFPVSDEDSSSDVFLKEDSEEGKSNFITVIMTPSII